MTTSQLLIDRLRICQKCLEEDKDVPRETVDSIWHDWNTSKPTDRNLVFLLIALCMTFERLREKISYRYWDVQQALSIPGRAEFACILSRIAPFLVQCWPTRVLGTDAIAEDPEDPTLSFVVPGINLMEFASELRLRQMQELLCIQMWDRPRTTFLQPPPSPVHHHPTRTFPPPGWVQRWSDTFAHEKKGEKFEADVEELHSRMRPLYGQDLRSICRKLVGLNPLTKRLISKTFTNPASKLLHVSTYPDLTFRSPSVSFIHSTGLFLVTGGGLYLEVTHAVEELLQMNPFCDPLKSFRGDAVYPEIMDLKVRVKESVWGILSAKADSTSTRPQLLQELGAEYAGVELADDGEEEDPVPTDGAAADDEEEDQEEEQQQDVAEISRKRRVESSDEEDEEEDRPRKKARK